jgi:hypothetical protein
VSEVHVSYSGNGSGLQLSAGGDLTLPRWSIERYGDSELFERAFGHPLRVG